MKQIKQGTFVYVSNDEDEMTEIKEKYLCYCEEDSTHVTIGKHGQLSAWKYAIPASEAEEVEMKIGDKVCYDSDSDGIKVYFEVDTIKMYQHENRIEINNFYNIKDLRLCTEEEIGKYFR